MAHGRLRTEKNCLNCNAQVYGRFCGVCGQENIEPKETFFNLVSHFVYDLFHYDGKVLSTLKTLIFKPGLLTHEYVRGRRASYLHPIRLYIFISAVFFIIFISFIFGDKANSHENANQLSSAQQGAIQKTIDQLNDTLPKISDTVQKEKVQQEIIALKKLPDFFLLKERSPFLPANAKLDSADIKAIDSSESQGLRFTGNVPASFAEYDKKQATLSAQKKDNWLKHAITVKLIALNNKYKYDKTEFYDSLKEHFLHSLPSMMFISLPVVALILSLLYIRRRKQFTYVQHGVFSVHVYSAVFVFILILYGLGVLNNYLHWKLISILKTVGVIFIFYYIYKAMRNFYEQRRWKTIFKYFILYFCYSVVLTLLMLIFLLTSLIQV